MEDLYDINIEPQIEIYGMKQAGDSGQTFRAYRMGKLLTMAGLRMRNPKASRAQLWRLWAGEHMRDELLSEVFEAEVV